MKARRYSVSMNADHFRRLQSEAERRGVSCSSLVEGWIRVECSGGDSPSVVTRDTAPPMVARLMEAIAEKPRPNPRGKSPDGLTARQMHEGAVRLQMAKAAARANPDTTTHAPRDGRDVPSDASKPQKVDVPARVGGSVML